MAFVKGMPRPANAGRKKGSKNKKTLLRVADVFADKNIEPVTEILRLIDQLDEPRDKLKAWLELLSYCQAKPRDEMPPDDGDEADALIENFENVTDETLMKIATMKNEAS